MDGLEEPLLDETSVDDTNGKGNHVALYDGTLGEAAASIVACPPMDQSGSATNYQVGIKELIRCSCKLLHREESAWPWLYRQLWTTKVIATLFIVNLVIFWLITNSINVDLSRSPSTCIPQDTCGTVVVKGVESEKGTCSVDDGSVAFNCFYNNTVSIADIEDCKVLCPDLARFGVKHPASCAKMDVISSNETTLSICKWECTDRVCLSAHEIKVKKDDETAVTVNIIVFVVEMLWSAMTLVYILLYRSKFAALSSPEVLRKLLGGLKSGTFMFSYSWGGSSGEQKSKEAVTELASIFECAWWDRKRLLPGCRVEELCVAAANDCKYGLVFISQNYVRSPICQTELATLRKKHGGIIAFVHSDVSCEEKILQELKAEGNFVFQVESKVTCLWPWLYDILLGMHVPEKWLDTFLKYSQHGYGPEKLPAGDFILEKFATCGIFQKLFETATPAINERWATTASALCELASGFSWFPRRIALAPSLAIIVQSLSGFRPFLQTDTLIINLTLESIAFLMVVFMTANIKSRKPSRFYRLPYVAHLLIVLHRLGIIGNDNIDPSTDFYQQPKRIATWKRYGKRLKRHRYLCTTKRKVISNIGEYNAPIPVYIGASKLKPFRLLEQLGVLRLVNIEEPAAFRCIGLQELGKDLTMLEADLPHHMYWTASSFSNLPPAQQVALKNDIVAVQQRKHGPETEAILLQILLTLLRTDPNGICTGKLGWKSKQMSTK